ncbi:MAG TPA: thiamine pyrophosphate-dependent dehydrogenase E1 component subunit alpha [Egicoccus sp.]|nr:thiamine pyrophosphate-dependent dehydrogenase E1 component subunit alpha [Egicoccus sp.]HSK23029.1 thiamine pyrophosphate-dependent dehydrogenase E1 component subunit alpha [Egicoccus sp.]
MATTTAKKTAKKTAAKKTAAKKTAAKTTSKRTAAKKTAKKTTARAAGGRKPAKPAGTEQLSEETRLALYRQVVRLRRFEERAYRLFMDGLVKGTSHLSLGMEAIAAGVAEAMRDGDRTFCTYRGHAHTLARGVPMDGVMAELLGRANGVCAGKGGSMHLTSVEHGVMGSYAIIGAHLPIALGSAWSAQLQGNDEVTVAFFGDGATNIGAFHEALNLAVVWNLPVVFVCENNLWMEYTPISSVTAVEHPAADRAAAYGLERIIVDGNDPEAVHLEAKKAIDKARAGGGPTMFEAMTYRHGGHSRADPGTYRPEEEVAEWLARDPLPTYRKRLLDLGVAESALDEIEQQAQADVDAATEAAKNGPLPDIESAFTDVWADGGSSWRN